MRKKLIYCGMIILLLTGFLVVQSASATIYEFNDNTIAFEGYYNPAYPDDTNGNPHLTKVQASVDNHCLKGIGVYYDHKFGTGLYNTGDFNSFFIDAHSTGYDWDYYVKLENTGTGYAAMRYDLPDNWQYTFANDTGDRIGHPNGIDTSSLTGTRLYSLGVLYGPEFNFVGVGFNGCGINLGDKWSLAVTQYCANDNFQAPVPEPATLVLLGSGMVLLAGFRRKRKK